MSVYKEGYHALELITKEAKQIWPDAADFGAPVKKDSSLWNWIKQLTEWYGIKSTRYASAPDKKHMTASIYVHLMDEWAVSDERKTEEEATEFYKVTYNKTPGIPNYDGFVEYYKVTDPKTIKELTNALEAQMA
jgi:hypothetical protein